MPKIDFYILTQSDQKSRLDFVCRLIEKAYKNQHRIYVHTNDQSQAHLIDELLWTYRDTSFLPHHLYGEGPEPPPPIQIGFDITPQKQRDVLMTLSDVIPTFYQQFSRVLEVISADEKTQTAGRERFRQYRLHGHSIQTHKLALTELNE